MYLLVMTTDNVDDHFCEHIGVFDELKDAKAQAFGATRWVPFSDGSHYSKISGDKHWSIVPVKHNPEPTN